jgi:hypothetical protein
VTFRAALPLIAALGLFCCCGHAPSAQRGGGSAMSSDDIFNAITSIGSQIPFRGDAVARATGRMLSPVAEESSEYFRVLRSSVDASQPFPEVEVREPTPLSPDKGGLVILSINSTPCVRQQDVMRRFGEEPELEPPTPRMPPGSPVYLRYRVAWGTLKFGFVPGNECLTTVVGEARR